MLGATNPVKQKLARGEAVIGTFIKSVDPAMTEIVCQSGFDFVILDNEHTAMNKETLVQLVRVAEIHGVPAIVRVRDDDTPQILQALDTGAYGVQVPNLRTAADAVRPTTAAMVVRVMTSTPAAPTVASTTMAATRPRRVTRG